MARGGASLCCSVYCTERTMAETPKKRRSAPRQLACQGRPRLVCALTHTSVCKSYDIHAEHVEPVTATIPRNHSQGRGPCTNRSLVAWPDLASRKSSVYILPRAGFEPGTSGPWSRIETPKSVLIANELHSFLMIANNFNLLGGSILSYY